MNLLQPKLYPPGFQQENEMIVAVAGQGLKTMFQGGQQQLEAHLHLVNSLNVFPVPDGDTGTNMLLTIRSALAEAESSPDEVGAVAAAIAHGALMGARGNSGVILSQFLQGFAHTLTQRGTLTAADLADAVQQGYRLAYQSVMTPVEGTILTVMAAAATAATRSTQTTRNIEAVMAEMVEAATLAQASTPDLLPILKEAGVTDSGGQGFLYLLEGCLHGLQGKAIEADLAGAAAPQLLSTLGIAEAAYGYDVQFLIQGAGLNVAAIRTAIEHMGWSTLVVGNEQTVKVHVHVHDPGQPISYGARQGILSDVVVENMEVQAKQFVQERSAIPLPPLAVPAQMTAHLRETMTTTATLCVAPSRGLAQILQSLGAAHIVFGGQTMNPSPQEFLEGIDQLSVENIIILPNNSNVILAAQQAQKLSSKQVWVAPTKTIPQGIAALLSFNSQADPETNAQRMLQAAQQVHTIEITQAARETSFSGFEIKAGDVMGLFDDELVSVGTAHEQVALEVLAKVDSTPYEVVTIYFGQDSCAEQAQALAQSISARYPEVELEVHEGGQPYYNYIISLE
jgi:hypothetical protein